MWEEFKKFALGEMSWIWQSLSSSALLLEAIVTSLVQDIFMPIIGAATGGLDFKTTCALEQSADWTVICRCQKRRCGARLRTVHYCGDQFSDNRVCSLCRHPKDESPEAKTGRTAYSRASR